jgi:predicted DNA-binding transcriptional regulator AlpA
LANAIDPPEDPRPEANLGPTLPARFDRSSEVKPGRTLPAGIEPMLGIDDLATLLSCSRRLVERMRSGGKVPKPDIQIGKCPRWKPATIRAWIERGGKL